jgi:NodT family efflux transporter outer membrane factor (OMF) lipoprotein
MKKYILIVLTSWMMACKAPKIAFNEHRTNLPERYQTSSKIDSSIVKINWREYFEDEFLIDLIDTALLNNQNLKIAFQHIEMAKSGALATSGRLRPMVNFAPSASLRRYGLYTMDGAGNITTDILPNKIVPTHLPDFLLGFQASWEIDLYSKLKNQNKAALARVWASQEANNFIKTNLVNNIAVAYYELIGLDNELEIVDQYIKIQENAVDLVKIQKEAAASNELVIKQFEAQLFKLQGMRYDLEQSIVEQESTINYLIGRFPKTIVRKKAPIESLKLRDSGEGIPASLLLNRPDLRQCEQELQASRLDLQVSRAAFLPSFNIGTILGLQAFRPDLLITKPQSLVYGFLGNFVAPLINKRAIQADFNYANSNQLAALYAYNSKIIEAYIEVYNQLMLRKQLEKSFILKTKESSILTESIGISDQLYRNNRATYIEVLLAQENALETQIELVRIKKMQLQTQVNIYKALGGGWK